MFDQGDILETVFRGCAAGTSLLIALVLAAKSDGGRTMRLGALFSFSIAIYVLVAGNATKALFGVMLELAIFISIAGTVFFWWFAAVLFDDDFRWRWWRIAPLVVLPGLYLLGRQFDGSPLSSVVLYIHLSANAVLFADAFRIAISKAGEDLVDPRRRFRFVFATIIAVFGVGVAVADIISSIYDIPYLLNLFHAAAIFAMNLVFGVWILTAREGLFASNTPVLLDGGVDVEKSLGPVTAADRPAYDQLMALMDEGVYREEGLTVALLAEKVGLAEHQLRKLINGALGFRNFSAFLNTRRIADAKTLLGDPKNARKQVLQTALDLGFGSIAPFNRAFKQATGKTPTEFRKEALGDG